MARAVGAALTTILDVVFEDGVEVAVGAAVEVEGVALLPVGHRARPRVRHLQRPQRIAVPAEADVVLEHVAPRLADGLVGWADLAPRGVSTAQRPPGLVDEDTCTSLYIHIYT